MMGYQDQQWRDLLRPLVEAMTHYFIAQTNKTFLSDTRLPRPRSEGGGT